MIDRFIEVFREGIAEGVFRPMDLRRTVVALGAVMYGTVVFGSYSKVDRTLTEMAEYTVEAFLQGIRTAVPEGKERVSP
jgi:hypothetical protein